LAPVALVPTACREGVHRPAAASEGRWSSGGTSVHSVDWSPEETNRERSLRELKSLSVVQRTSFADMACSIARTLDVAGEPWSPLVLRDVYVGISRFDDIQRDLGISRKVLTQRL